MTKTIWPKASSKRVSKSLEAHSVLALAVSALIYILVVSGTASVFNREFQRWEQPNAPEMAAISPLAAERAALTVFKSEPTPTTHLYINHPQPDLPRTVITTDTQAFFAEADGSIALPEHFPWTQFLLDLHYYLHLPHVLGLTVVGTMGVFLIALSASGLLAHPRIFRDAFTFRRGSGRVTLADMHNRLSVWTAPFHLSNALTGAILGLATILGVAIAAARYEGDLEKVFAPVFGEEAELTTERDMPAIAEAHRHFAATFPDLALTYTVVHDPGTEGQHIQLIAKHKDRLIFGDYYNYDAGGAYLGNTGLSDGTIGQQIAGSVYNVHFGNWGGLPVKLAYGLFGAGLMIIVCSGLAIYFAKRREKGRAAPRLEGAWEGVVWGTPFGLTVSALFAVNGIDGQEILVAVFWAGLAMAAGAGQFVGKKTIRQVGLSLMAMLLGALIFLTVGVHGKTVVSVSARGITLTLLALAMAAGYAAYRLRSDSEAANAAVRSVEVAS